MDAIVVGIGTALADDPELTARPPGPRAPVRIVLDSLARLASGESSGPLRQRGSRLVAVCGQAPPDRREGLRQAGCEILEFANETKIPIRPLLDQLVGGGLTNLLLEGGGRVLGAFFDAGKWTRWMSIWRRSWKAVPPCMFRLPEPAWPKWPMRCGLIVLSSACWIRMSRIQGILPRPWRKPRDG